MTATVLIIVLITKFTKGAWIAIAAMAAIYALMTAIRKHYDTRRRGAAGGGASADRTMPARNHAMVLVSKLHMPTLRALSYAKATRPDVLEAVTVNVDDDDTRQLVMAWEKENFRIPLKVIESPYREITKPVLDYVKRVKTDNPRDVVTVFIPEYVVGHWWEQLLHNQSALRLKGRLLFQPGVMVSACRGSWRRPQRCATRTCRAWSRPRGLATDGLPKGNGVWLGRQFEVEIGSVAHGGHCVARHEGRVLFVRHTLPGERVIASVTRTTAARSAARTRWRCCQPSPDRVEPPCPFSGPGVCGGCDWQHASWDGAAGAEGPGRAASSCRGWARSNGMSCGRGIAGRSAASGGPGSGWPSTATEGRASAATAAHGVVPIDRTV